MINSYLSKTLLHCLNVDEIHLVVFGFHNSIEIYSSEMTFLKSIKLPFKPFSYLVVSKTGLLIFDTENKNGYADLNAGTFTENSSPLGTSLNKKLIYSCVFEMDGGFLFFPHDTSCQTKTFFYSPSNNKFKRIDIKLPDYCFAYNAGKYGAFYYQDEEGNFQACSFKTVYEKKEFASELTINKEIIYRYVDRVDSFDLPCQVAYLSMEKGSLILVSQDKPDTAAFGEYMRNLDSKPIDSSALDLIKHHDSGKIVLIENGIVKKTIELNEMPFKAYSYPFSDSVLFVSHGGVLDAYSTDDLTLLASFPWMPTGITLPDGRMVYEINGDTYLSDSSPLAMATKKLDELKRGH